MRDDQIPDVSAAQSSGRTTDRPSGRIDELEARLRMDRQTDGDTTASAGLRSEGGRRAVSPRRLGAVTLVVGVIVAAVLVFTSLGSVAPPGGTSYTNGTLGVVDGVAHDDAIAVTGEDGLNASEREAMTTRAMARIERLRDLDFREPVNVTVISREEYRSNDSASDEDDEHGVWNNQVWKGLFLVGSDRNVSDVLDDTYGTSVQGYYVPENETGHGGNIVIVSDSDTPQLARHTLVHELVHALQDQHFGLAEQPDTQDRQLARNALVEGEARRLTTRYEDRCESSWACVEVSPPAGVTEQSESDRYRDRVFPVIYFPYATGEDFVEQVADRGGTDALNRLYDDLPASTEQVIHPDAHPDEDPVNVTVPDRSTDDWARFDHDPVADITGEASIYVMADVHDLGERQGDQYDFRNPVSAGWGGDALVPYRTTDGVDRYGYVWETVWDTDTDARQFHDAYRELLIDTDAEIARDDTYRIPPADPFGGAYRVVRDGRTVRIVHGPTLAALSRIHGS